MTNYLFVAVFLAAAMGAAIACDALLGESWMILGTAAAGGLSAVACERLKSLGELRFLLVGGWTGLSVYVAGN